MDTITAGFVDGIGAAAATSGVLSQLQGRIFALLYLTPEQLSLDQIADELQQSKSNISVNISKEAAKGVVSLLNPRDQVGISAAYGTLTIPMQHVTDKASINKQIDGMDPADPNSYRPDLQNAEQVLLHTTAKIKHVILLGDGDAFDRDYQAQVVKMANENITVSAVETNSANLRTISSCPSVSTTRVGKARHLS